MTLYYYGFDEFWHRDEQKRLTNVSFCCKYERCERGLKILHKCEVLATESYSIPINCVTQNFHSPVNFHAYNFDKKHKFGGELTLKAEDMNV
jgi:hypothetical protein